MVVSSDEAFFSAVNYRGFPRQLTVEGEFGILHVFLSLLKRVNNNFPGYF